MRTVLLLTTAMLLPAFPQVAAADPRQTRLRSWSTMGPR